MEENWRFCERKGERDTNECKDNGRNKTKHETQPMLFLEDIFRFFFTIHLGFLQKCVCFSVCYWQVGSFLGTNTSVFFALADQIGVKVQSLFLNLKQVEILWGEEW